MIDIVTILQGFGISLGVGASTLAVTNFFVAIWDGKIDDGERRMMGVVYIVLRVAMVLILLTTVAHSVIALQTLGFVDIFNLQILVLTLILFINAVMMTLHLIPATFGPAIQASAWYTMGFLSLFRLIGPEVSFVLFPLAYILMLVFATCIINFLMLLAQAEKNKAYTNKQ